MTTRTDCRAQRILRHAVERGRTTMRGCIVAIEPGCKPANMTASMYALVTTGKLITKRDNDFTWFYPTATALIDGRTAANAAKAGKPRGPNRKPADAPSQPVRTRIDAEAKAAIRNRKRTTARVLQPSDLRTPPRPAGTEPETVEEFLRRGGQVEQLPHGATGQPFAHIGHEAINQASWRARVRSHDDELAA